MIEPTLSSPHRTLFAGHSTRLLVMWLLALVLPLQGAALGVFAAKGPAHLHMDANPNATSRPLVLDDVRRWKAAPVADPHVQAAFGHVHAGSAPQRHHHARSDAGVVVTSADAPDTEEAVGVGGFAVLALIPAPAVWGIAEQVCAASVATPVTLRTRCVAPLDRPPRASA